MELCARRAHTHPLGVLRYSVADSVILFSNITDMNRTQHVLPDMTEFRDEAIVIQTMAPVEVQVTAFQTMWHSNPTAGSGESHTPPYQTPPNEETPRCIHAQFGDLNDHELRQLIRDLSQEIVQHKSTASLAIPLLEIGHTHRTVVYQRKMTRRSPFQEGEGSLLDHNHCQ